ncbi:MAG TPA: glycoside hydrolase family 97 N-terminal domain-containing protein, partial [Bacteroidota bacterium]
MKNLICLLIGGLLCQVAPGQEQDRPARSRRLNRVVPMQEVSVTSPDGKVRFTLSPNAERLTFMVLRDGVSFLDASPIVMKLDEFDLSAGVVFKSLERYQVDETYPWQGAH